MYVRVFSRVLSQVLYVFCVSEDSSSVYHVLHMKQNQLCLFGLCVYQLTESQDKPLNVRREYGTTPHVVCVWCAYKGIM